MPATSKAIFKKKKVYINFVENSAIFFPIDYNATLTSGCNVRDILLLTLWVCVFFVDVRQRRVESLF